MSIKIYNEIGVNSLGLLLNNFYALVKKRFDNYFSGIAILNL